MSAKQHQTAEGRVTIKRWIVILRSWVSFYLCSNGVWPTGLPIRAYRDISEVWTACSKNFSWRQTQLKM